MPGPDPGIPGWTSCQSVIMGLRFLRDIGGELVDELRSTEGKYCAGNSRALAMGRGR